MRISDWSSDVCSSDLVERDLTDFLLETKGTIALHQRIAQNFGSAPVVAAVKSLGARTNAAREKGHVHYSSGGLLTTPATSSEERRLGQERVSPCRSRWACDN